jgi:ribulose-5-phosphate 4-epimerase/fuculose-1-phosphate aldolase
MDENELTNGRSELCRLYEEVSKYAPKGEGNAGLVIRETGNRTPLGLLVSPTAGSTGRFGPSSMVRVDMNGIPWPNQLEPTSELPTYLEIARTRPDVDVIGHTHGEEGTTISCLLDISLRTLPLIHYPQAKRFGGDGTVHCSDRLQAEDVVASQLAAQKVATALGDRNVAFQSDHGIWAVGHIKMDQDMPIAIDAVLAIFQTVEINARRYMRSLAPIQLTPHIWSAEEAKIIRTVISQKVGQDRKIGLR